MSDHEHDADLVEDVPGTEEVEGIDASILGELRREHQRIRAEKEVVLPIPGYAKLGCRYKRLTLDDEEKIARKAGARASKGERHAAFGAVCDELIKACDQFMVRGDDGWEPLSLTKPVGYDVRLARAFDLDPLVNGKPNARKILLELFGGEGHENAVDAHHDRYYAWVRGNGGPSVDDEVDAELVGE